MAARIPPNNRIPPAERRRVIYHPINRLSSNTITTICIVLCFAFIIGGVILALNESISLKGAGIMILIGFGFISAAEFYLLPLQRELRSKSYSIVCDFVKCLYAKGNKSYEVPDHDQLRRAFRNPDFLKAFREWLKNGDIS